MYFELLSEIGSIEKIAEGNSLRAQTRLRRLYGGNNWRKLKGVARVELLDGTVRDAEIHWYEAHGVGRLELKIKRLLD